MEGKYYSKSQEYIISQIKHIIVMIQQLQIMKKYIKMDF